MHTFSRLLIGSLLAVSAASQAAIFVAPPKPPGLPAPPVVRLPAPGRPLVIGDHRRVYGPVVGHGYYRHRHWYGRRHYRY